ncbi:diversity-generating retroelement protein Avd [Thermodesulfovibrio thiophilus]|uniref:diversity-generating retroelement protein Avd n=1 Tax=Thermodesulfovibrio thiophilus TaxID=340095 RepID=UPI00048CE165|nr:diversity-generating retroelement protein Avd [Thermodesulfovibrio thiophilus]
MNNLIIYQKVYDCALYLFPIVERFPKHEKFVLCTHIKSCLIGIARLIVKANKSKNKKSVLYDIDICIEELKFLVRFAHDRKYLSHKSYEYVSKLISEIGRLLGGWIKSEG